MVLALAEVNFWNNCAAVLIRIGLVGSRGSRPANQTPDVLLVSRKGDWKCGQQCSEDTFQYFVSVCTPALPDMPSNFT